MTYRVFLSYNAAQMEHDEKRHAQAIMNEIAENQGFKVIDSQPQTLFDGWEFWIESPNPPDLPPFAHICPWEPPPN